MVIDTGGAGGFAIAAGQASVEVLLGFLRDFIALQHLFDQVDAASWPVQFIAEQLIGRTGGVAESAVHAGAQDAFGFFGAGQLPGAVAQGRLHGSKLRVQACRVENAPRIELLLQAAVVAHQRGGQRLERAVDQTMGIAGDVAAHLSDDLANERRFGIRLEPALGAAPIDQLPPWQG